MSWVQVPLPTPFPKVPAPDEMTLLMQRLRTLQLRLNSVDPGAVKEATERVLEWRSVAGDAKGAESRRRNLHNYVTGSVDAVAADFGTRLERDFLPRLTNSFQTLVPEIHGSAESFTGARALGLEDALDSRVKAAEMNSSAADAQVAELRNASADVYRKLSDVTERLDQIWSDENTESIGGWRDAMEKMRTDREANEKTPMEAFRDDAFGDDDEEEESSSVRLTCPLCKEKKGKRQPRTGFFEDLAGVISIAPYRCSRCMVKFYRYRPSRKR